MRSSRSLTSCWRSGDGEGPHGPRSRGLAERAASLPFETRDDQIVAENAARW